MKGFVATMTGGVPAATQDAIERKDGHAIDRLLADDGIPGSRQREANHAAHGGVAPTGWGMLNMGGNPPGGGKKGFWE